jgi:hypothetical protein
LLGIFTTLVKPLHLHGCQSYRTDKHAKASDPDQECTTLESFIGPKAANGIVRVLNVVDSCIPSARAKDIEEERRLLHVAMTRAKDQLDLIIPR